MIETRMQLQAVIESNPEVIANGFDAAVWIDNWLMQPLPAIGWIVPSALLNKPRGKAMVVKALSQALEGSYS